MMYSQTYHLAGYSVLINCYLKGWCTIKTIQFKNIWDGSCSRYSIVSFFFFFFRFSFFLQLIFCLIFLDVKFSRNNFGTEIVVNIATRNKKQRRHLIGLKWTTRMVHFIIINW